MIYHCPQFILLDFFKKEIRLEFQPQKKKKKSLYVAIHSYFGFFPTPQINEWLNCLRRLPPSSSHCIFLQKQHLSPRGYLLILMLLFSHSVMFFLQPHGLQHARLHCPSLSPTVYLNSCPLSRWCHPTIYLIPCHPFSSPSFNLFPASGSFLRSQFFASGGQSIGASGSASTFPMNIQGWFPLGLTGWISLLSKGLSRVFSSAE